MSRWKLGLLVISFVAPLQISNEQVLQISNDDALLLQTLGSVLHSESDPLIRARPEEVDSVGVDCKLLEDL